MQRNVSKEMHIGEGMTKGTKKKMKRDRTKDRPKGSQIVRQKKRNSCIRLIVSKIAKGRAST